MDENNLLLNLSEGDERSFSAVFDLYWEKLFTYVVRVLKDKDDSLDIVQETFAALWLQREQLKSVKSLKAYLFSIAHYKAIHAIKNDIRHKRYLSSLGDYLDIAFESLEESYDANELAAFIEKEIQNLPEKMRHVFVLSRKECLSHKEIAEKLSITENTVKKQVGYSIKYLKIKIDEQYFVSKILVLIFFEVN